MLPKNIIKSLWRPTVKYTAFAATSTLMATPTASSPSRTPHSPSMSAPSAIPLTPPRPLSFTARLQLAENPADKVMPTQFIIPEVQEKVDCGTGQPAQRGHRKPLVWKRRHPWFDRQWTLDMKRQSKGPATPYFPEGVPFTPIRKLQTFAGRSFKVNAGRRRKVRLSLKRGRRKLL